MKGCGQEEAAEDGPHEGQDQDPEDPAARNEEREEGHQLQDKEKFRALIK